MIHSTRNGVGRRLVVVRWSGLHLASLPNKQDRDHSTHHSHCYQHRLIPILPEQQAEHRRYRHASHEPTDETVHYILAVRNPDEPTWLTVHLYIIHPNTVFVNIKKPYEIRLRIVYKRERPQGEDDPSLPALRSDYSIFGTTFVRRTGLIHRTRIPLHGVRYSTSTIAPVLKTERERCFSASPSVLMMCRISPVRCELQYSTRSPTSRPFSMANWNCSRSTASRSSFIASHLGRPLKLTPYSRARDSSGLVALTYCIKCVSEKWCDQP